MKGTKNPISGQTDGKTRSHGDNDEVPTKERHRDMGEYGIAKLLILIHKVYVLMDKSPTFNVLPRFFSEAKHSIIHEICIYGT